MHKYICKFHSFMDKNASQISKLSFNLKLSLVLKDYSTKYRFVLDVIACHKLFLTIYVRKNMSKIFVFVLLNSRFQVFFVCLFFPMHASTFLVSSHVCCHNIKHTHQKNYLYMCYIRSHKKRILKLM